MAKDDGAYVALASGFERKTDSIDETTPVTSQDRKTDYTRWRLKDERGRQTWHYLQSDEQVSQWPQTAYDRYHLGLPTNLPSLAQATTPLSSARNGLSFFSNLQLPSGQWACEYGGPMFLLPGLVITWYVTGTPVPDSHSIEIKNYLFARQNPDDGGWGLHIEGESSVFGTAMNYVVLRLLGADADDARVVRARACLHRLGGALYGPHWAKFWLSVLGVCSWDAVNPVPPELCVDRLLPDWVPIAPWRWWIHMRQVFLPMSYIYSRRFSHPLTPLTRSIRNEIYTASPQSINFLAYRNAISPADNYHPKSALLNVINWALVNIWDPYLRTADLKRRAEDWAWKLIQMEDENTAYANLGPVNGPMNFLCCFIRESAGVKSTLRHRDRMADFLWVKDEGMLMNGTNGVQTWDTAFLIQAVAEAGLADEPQYREMLTRALEFLDGQQIPEDCVDQSVCYRQQRKGAWAFSTREQGYTVSDCTAEGLKSVLALQTHPSGTFPKLVSDERIRDAVDVMLTMQNPSGGFSSYEPTRGSEYLEYLNAAEVFGRIMVEYDYPECTTAVVTALVAFQEHDPVYRADEIAIVKDRALAYIRRAQRADGSWYGSWGICFTYAGMFALEALHCVGETYSTSPRVRRACRFFLERQNADGGWGESYRSCETGTWTPHPGGSQVVQTAWVVIALLEAGCREEESIARACRLLVKRQQADGSWAQEGIEGVFNKSCMISYPNYKFIFPIKALGMYAKVYGNEELLQRT